MTLEGVWIGNGRPVRVEIAAGKITGIRELAAPAAEDRRVWLAPGLIDVQVNGFAGADFNGASPTPDEVSKAIRALWRAGVTRLCPTVTTKSPQQITAALAAIAAAAEDRSVGRSIAAIHLEGPYIAAEDGPRGAHPREWVKDPDWDEFRRWQDAAGGRIRLVTLAPERPGALRFIEQLREAGLIPCIGHTGAPPETIRAAVDAGALLATHLGNGAHAVLPRHPNYIWEQLADDRLLASFIADGEHLPPATLRAMLRAKGVARSILVSDAVAIANLPPGRYRVLGREVELLPSGRIQLAGTPYLAGASRDLLFDVAQALRWGGLSPADAFRMATENPARLLGLDKEGPFGLAVGARADLIRFAWGPDGTPRVIETRIAGEVCYQAE